jgi:hypothetical protein
MQHAGREAFLGRRRITSFPSIDRLPAGHMGAFLDDMAAAYIATRPTTRA